MYIFSKLNKNCCYYYYYYNHNYNKILISDWLSTALISALRGQCNRTARVTPISNWTVHAITRALRWLFFTAGNKEGLRISCALI